MGTPDATRSRRIAAALLLLAGAALAAAPVARAAEIPCHATEAAATAQQLPLVAGQSRILNYDAPVRNVTVANPAVADLLVLSPRQIYVLGRQPGRTNLTLICEHGTVTLFEVTVTPDVGLLKEKLHELFPGEQGVQVLPAGEGITLAGTVSSAPVLSQVLTVAEPFAPARVISLLAVGGVQQVMLEVRVAEISKDTARRLGINLGAIAASGSRAGLMMLGGVMTGGITPEGLEMVNHTGNLAYSFNSIGSNWTLFIDALKSNGLISVLAEPNLIAISGQKASFLAGGEFPYEIVGDDGRIGIQWKKFGVELYFTPTVLANGRIGLAVNPKVSQIGELITVAGRQTPKLLSREVDTTIELGDGQSFAIAGLLQQDIREAAAKYPVLGEIPILGALFRSAQFQKSETELLVIVTPHLVRPVNADEQPLPTDSFVEPDDFEFYLKGSLEGRPRPGAAARARARGGLEGDFGHIVPE